MMLYVSFLIAGLVVATLLTWLVRRVANRYGLAFGPSTDRHIHTSPIPRLGGIAIFVTFVLLYGAYRLFGGQTLGGRSVTNDVFKVLVPAAGMFIVGLLDDLRGLSAKTKLLAEVVGGGCLFYNGMHFACFHLQSAPDWVNSGLFLLTTVFWVVLVCNAINLIDGLDGLASGAALFSMATIFTVALVEGRHNIAIATLVLGGSMLGFLIFNFNPASIFLGDGGSLFVGFMLSGFVLAEAQTQSVVDSLAIPIISLALPLTDTALSVLRRFLSGHSLFGADREHIHHKLLELGLTQRQVMWILYGVSASCAVLSLALLHPSNLVVVPVAGVLLMVIFFGVRKLGYHELAEFQRVWKRVRQQKQVFARDIAMRKATTKLGKLHNFDDVLQILESCLQHDFDGFELVLYPEAFGLDNVVDEKTVMLVWRNGFEEKVFFTLELSSPRYGVMGTISCHRQTGSGWLVDTDLLAGGLRTSLGAAIDNCVSHSVKSVFETVTPEPWDAKDNFRPAAFRSFPADQEVSAAAGDD